MWLNAETGKNAERTFLGPLLKLTIEPMVVWSGQSVVGLNDSALRLLSLNSNQISESSATDLLADMFHQFERELDVREDLASGTIQLRNDLTLEYRAQTIENGEQFIVAVLSKPKRESVDEDLLEVKSRFETIFQNSPVAHIVVTPRGIIRDVNDAACDLLGYETDQLLKRSIMSFQPPLGEGVDESQQILQAILDGDQLMGVEIPLIDASSERVWVNLTSSPIETGGRVAEISIMAIDITRRREAEMREEAEANRANLYLEAITHDL
ncbi:PAS domain S-box protein, partial [Candidatus Thorarchaeota archaeon]